MENLKYNTEEEYEEAMAIIYQLMQKGEANVTAIELETVRVMALAAQAYEREHHYDEELRRELSQPH
jgi:HTH-type transcriptional regulator / antitoxin HigA